jgi:hypothetical protein
MGAVLAAIVWQFHLPLSMYSVNIMAKVYSSICVCTEV